MTAAAGSRLPLLLYLSKHTAKPCFVGEAVRELQAFTLLQLLISISLSAGSPRIHRRTLIGIPPASSRCGIITSDPLFAALVIAVCLRASRSALVGLLLLEHSSRRRKALLDVLRNLCRAPSFQISRGVEPARRTPAAQCARAGGEEGGGQDTRC